MKRLLWVLAIVITAIMLSPAKTVTIKSQNSQPDIRAELIDSYYHTKHMPLEGSGEKMIEAADANNIDWRLLPAISVRESSGGLHACGANPFGWNSCKTTFGNVDEAIKTVAANLGGNVTTTKIYYAGKTTIGKIHAYNPEAIVPGYAASVIKIMGTISPTLKVNML